jgi:Cytosol aminopeptidase family, N-terminal domain
MEFLFVPPDLRRLDDANAELLACCVWKDQWPMRGLAGLIDWRLSGRLHALARVGFLLGDVGEVLFVPGRPQLRFEKLLLLGLGARSDFGEATFRSVVLHLLRSLEGLGVRRAVVELPGRAEGMVQAERAAELVLECVRDSPAHDSWWLVEEPDAQRRFAQHAQDERRRSPAED